VLSPFPPLALLRALCLPHRTPLLDEVHVALLRLLAARHRPPRGDGTRARAKALHWGFMDRDNWPLYAAVYVAARRSLSHATATPQWEGAEELAQGWDEAAERRAGLLAARLEREEHQLLPVQDKVALLEYLCERAMDLPEVALTLADRAECHDAQAVERARFAHADGHAEACRVCLLGGDLLLCDFCPGVYHAACVHEKPRALPPNWMCPECRVPDPSYFAARVPQLYCRVSFRSDPARREHWLLRVVHGFVLKQVGGPRRGAGGGRAHPGVLPFPSWASL
jgi:hypothetical protein